MSVRLAVYDSEAVTLNCCGIPVTDGRAEKFVTIDKQGDSFGVEESSDGAVMRYATHGSLYIVTVALKGMSNVNPMFSALHALDCNQPNGAGIGIFLLKDNNGSTLCSTDKCWITRPPAAGFGKTREDCEWVFNVVATPLQMLIGGN